MLIHRYSLTVLSAAFLVLLGSLSALATPSQDIALQMRLSQEGFLTGATDGRVGSATRKAVAAYAEKYHLKNDRKSVEKHMLARADVHRGTMVPDDVWEKAVEGAKSGLADPFSAHFTKLYYFKSSKGNTVVCGLVNAKNAYGAYTGDQFFEALVIGSGAFALSGIATFDGSADYCQMGVSLDDFKTK